MDINRRHPFFWIVLVAAGVIASLYIHVGTLIYQYGELDKDLGWECHFEAGNYVVQKVDPSGYAAGKLKEGDRIVSLNGSPPVYAPGVMGFEYANLSFR